MSGVAKSVKKVFKKVAKVVKVVAPIAVTAGALIFSAGSAMGISAFSGGWGGAVGNLMRSAGITGTLGNVLTGAITQAGYGGIVGLVGGAVAGDPMKGMQYGSAAGAVTGAATGALQSVPTATQPGTPQQGRGGLMTGAPGVQGTAAVPSPIPAAPTPAPPGMSYQTAAAPSVGSGALDFLSNNQEMIGGLMTGLGQSLVSGDDAEAAEKAAMERDQEQRDWISANYATSGRGLMTKGDTDAVVAGQSTSPTPSQKWVYDRVQHRVVLTPANG